LAAKARILVVDDEPKVLDHFEELLRSEGYDVIRAGDGRKALACVRDDKPDLVILDVVMPELDGLEVCRILKSRPGSQFLPIIIVTGKSDIDSRVEGLKLGADDYMIKPAESRELVARIEALLRIKDLQDQIASSLKEVEDKSVTDALTGLYNSRYLQERIKDEFKRAERYSEPLSCIAIQMDTYDSLLKQSGQDRTDDVVRQVAGILKNGVREFDVVVRNTDDRFVILLPRTHFTGSLSVATRIWKSLHKVTFESNGPLEVPISMGVAFFPNKDVTSANALIGQAEQALQKAAEAGANQICLYQHTTYFYRPDMGG